MAGLLSSSLALVGYALLVWQGSAQSGVRLLAPLGEAPSFSVLIAGLDVEYCAWATPRAPARRCKAGETTPLVDGKQTDTLILADFFKTDVRLLSIPRDTWLPTLGRKINASYKVGGPEQLKTDLESLLGKRIDYYAVVRTEYVETLIDAVGGLDVTVPKGQKVDFTDRAAGVDFHLKEGSHSLGGRDGVLYLRVRKGFGDDYGRMDRQKSAIGQLLNKIRSAKGLSALPRLLSTFGSGVESNANLSLLEAMRPHLSSYRLDAATLPTQEISGFTGLALDREAYSKLENPEAALQTPLENVVVRIVNASGVEGLGRKLRTYLERRGFKIAEVESGDKSNESSQVITRTELAAANQYASFLGLSRLQALRFPVNAGEVMIYLGVDAGERFAALMTL